MMSGLAQLANKKAASDTRKKLVAARSLGFSAATPPSVAGSSAGSASAGKRQRGGKGKAKAEEAVRSAKSLKPAMTRHSAPRRQEQASADAASSAAKALDNEEDAMPDVDEEKEESDEDDLLVVGALTKPPTRNRDGTLIEHVPLGPVQHRALAHDPDFNTIEPNSGIRLK